MNTNTANLEKMPRTHKRVAATMPTDTNIEFIGIPSTKEVIWFQYGNQHSFENLPIPIITKLASKYYSDTCAVAEITFMATDYKRQLEIYTYYIYGDADFTPDVIDGELQPAENFRDKKDCILLKWNSKDITIDGQPLNTREINLIDLMMEGLPDKVIAHVFGITLSTLEYHKKRLYTKANVSHKDAFLLKILNERIN